MEEEKVEIKGRIKPGYLLVEQVDPNKEVLTKSGIIIPKGADSIRKNDHHPFRASVVLSNSDIAKKDEIIAIGAGTITTESTKHNGFVYEGEIYFLIPEHEVLFVYE